ncbi:MAG: cation:proton antiporter [Gemmatimonadota bacterium]
MTDFLILQNLGFILFAAAFMVLLLRLIRVPTLIAYMAAGLLLGPVTGLMTASEPVELIAETGIALLLFLVGLELNLDHIRGVGRVAVIGGTVQIVLTALIGGAVAMLFGLPAPQTAVVALGMTFSSTVVVVKLLGQKRELGSLHGRIGVGILLVQDVAVILALTLFVGLGGPGDSDAGAIAAGVIKAFAGMAGLAVAAALAARYVLPRLFRSVERSADTVFIWSLAWCFLFIVAAELAHLSVELGAFIAGVSLAQLEFSESLRRRVQPIVNFFLAVFFVSLGLQTQPGAALDMWPLVLAICVVVLLVKPVIIMVTVNRLGYGARSSFRAGLVLAQMSEFSFILCGLALSAGMLGPEMMSVITVAGFITISASAYLILDGDGLVERAEARGLLRLLGGRGIDEEDADPVLSGHVIVVGMNTLGSRLAALLTDKGETVLAIDSDAGKLNRVRGRTLVGTVDDLAVLEEAGYKRALLVMSALQIEDTNNLLAHRCRRAGVPAAIHAFDTSLIDELVDIGVARVIVSKHDGTREIAERMRAAGVLD